ncbi:hypothetical protein [Thiorhodococcus drewsii]|uniref:hypothetical protein n=1 Tax=Thiorhodococcus drewsii TaxID=210408 RepID=UPI000594E067|nr:hypothetical protein [Thiorhodococcus drewsii]
MARLVLRLTGARQAADMETIYDETLAALMDGRLKGQERDRVLAVLDQNTDAYLVWLAGAAQREQEHGEQQVRRAARVRRMGWLSATLAAGVLGVFLVLEPGSQHGLDARIDVGLAALHHSRYAPQSLSGIHYGFAGGSEVDHSTAEIQLGYKTARSLLANLAQEPQVDDPDSLGYQFGRWIALIEAGATCQPPPEDMFWAEQRSLAERFMEASSAGSSDGGKKPIGEVAKRLQQRLSSFSTEVGAHWRYELEADILRIRLMLGLLATHEATSD